MQPSTHSIHLLTVAVALAAVNCSAEEASSDRFSMDDFAAIEKIDIHFHLHTDNTDFVAMARRDRFGFLNIATQSAGPEVMELKHRTIFLQYQANPDRVAPVSSFSMDGWDQPDWQQKTIRFLDDTFQQGAVGVKVWKNIGMDVRDKTGALIMIDDPKLDPIFDHLERRGIVLMGHLGEPKNCWLPLDQMTVNNDRNYFRRNPQYHMYLRPDMPTYQQQIDARDQLACTQRIDFDLVVLASDRVLDQLALIGHRGHRRQRAIVFGPQRIDHW